VADIAARYVAVEALRITIARWQSRATAYGDVRADENAEVANRGDRQHINDADLYRCGWYLVLTTAQRASQDLGF